MDDLSMLHDGMLSWLDAQGSILGYVVPFLVVITILVFVHELGHYLVGRFFKIGVEVFSVGFGRELFGWKDRHGTCWRLSWIPIGGYVRFAGEQSGKKASKRSKQRSYDQIPAWQRILVLMAGPGANFAFAAIAVGALFLIVGQAYLLPQVSQVFPDTPAERAGIEVGDTILSIDDQPIERFSDVVKRIQSKGRQSVDITLRGSDGAIRRIRPMIESRPAAQDKTIGFLGVASNNVDFRPVTFLEAFGTALDYMVGTSSQILYTISDILSGRRSSEELGGPIRIAEFSNQAWKEGGVGNLVIFMALISINLAIINLLPIPPLDGGGILLCVYEAIFGKKHLPAIQSFLYRFGTALILALLVFITWNDIARLIAG